MHHDKAGGHLLPHLEHPPLSKIIATLGPATDCTETLEKLVDAGATVFRLNLSHGTFEDHARRFDMVRAVSKTTGRPLAVLGDLPGPKIRVSGVPAGGFELISGEDVIIRHGLGEAIREEGRVVLGCNYDAFAREVLTGQRVLINDGAIRMLVVDQAEGDVICRVTVGGVVSSRKGINLPDSDLSVSALSDQDLRCVEWGVKKGIDYLGLSFVRRGKEVAELRERLSRMCIDGVCGTGLDQDPTSRIPVIAKIETPQAVENFAEIAEAADAIMVARGDLGVEMEIAEVPAVQKMLIREAHRVGKPCIVATQMLESMIKSPSPTRAEVSDVANAILDGADALMLSGETAVGKYPVLAVQTVRKVAVATESSAQIGLVSPGAPSALQQRREHTPALAHGAWYMARDVGAEVIAVWSQDGASARYLSRHSFNIPIVAFSSDERAVRRMCLLYGVWPVHLDTVPEHRSDFAAMADAWLINSEIAESGVPIILIGGKPLDDARSTNTVAIRYLGELTGKTSSRAPTQSHATA